MVAHLLFEDRCLTRRSSTRAGYGSRATTALHTQLASQMSNRHRSTDSPAQAASFEASEGAKGAGAHTGRSPFGLPLVHCDECAPISAQSSCQEPGTSVSGLPSPSPPPLFGSPGLQFSLRSAPAKGLAGEGVDRCDSWRRTSQPGCRPSTPSTLELYQGNLYRSGITTLSRLARTTESVANRGSSTIYLT